MGRDTSEYDAVNRLVKAHIAHGTSLEDINWNYDAFGNMLLQHRSILTPPSQSANILENSFSLNTTRNQITAYRSGSILESNVSVDYDINGNLIHDRNFDHIFDLRSRLIEV